MVRVYRFVEKPVLVLIYVHTTHCCCLIDAMPLVTDATLTVTEGPGVSVPVCVDSGIDNNGLIELPLTVTFTITNGKASKYKIAHTCVHVYVY